MQYQIDIRFTATDDPIDFELNRTVMEQRNGAPWVERDTNSTLRVRVKSEVDQLRRQHQIESEWDYDYFFSSYLQIASKALRV